MTKRALIVVDVQPTFCEGGALGVEGGNATAERIAAFLDKHQKEYDLVVSTQDWHRDPGAHFSDNPDFIETWPAHGVAGTEEANLHPALQHIAFDESFKKGMYSAAYSGFEGLSDDGKSLNEVLKEHNIEDVDVVGIALSHCVMETALDAKHEHYNTTVFLDLTVPVTPEQGETAIKRLRESGVTLKNSTDK